MFEGIKNRLAKYLFPPRPLSHARMYNMAKQSRLTVGWGNQTSSEDTELASSLRIARNRSRALIRDSAYAKRAKVVVQTNIVGSGIGLQARVMNSRGGLNERVNDEIEEQWERWGYKDSCHTGQSLCFADFERVIIGQVFEAGECFVRLYASRFGSSKIPFAMELIEAERIADDTGGLPGLPSPLARLGIELNAFGAPQFYLIRTIHPGDIGLTQTQPSKIERVGADLILHIRIIERWPQTRAMPWLHAAARKLNDMDGLTEAEITAARAAACYMGFIELPNAETKYGDEQVDGSMQSELEPAMIERLNPGEKFTFAAPNRPNAQLDPFMRMMLREVAAGAGCSYEGLSRDYSQSNYSSSRLSLIDDRDLWRTLQSWFIREFREIVHKRWLQAAVLSGALPSISLAEYGQSPEKFEAARFPARGWSWVDPTSEVEAYKEAVLAGFMTVSDVIRQTGEGRDLEDVLKERRIELDRMKEARLLFSTDPSTVEQAPPPTAPAPKAPVAPAEPAANQEKEPAQGRSAAQLIAELESLR